MKQMQMASGVITLVQEHRFQLREDSGRHRLFILAHDAPQEWADLAALAHSDRHVTVFYRDIGGANACAAHDVFLH